MFKIVSSGLPATIDEFRRQAATMTESSAYRTSHSVGYTYKAIGPVIDGDAMQAERANKH
jgi:hypothetical protein